MIDLKPYGAFVEYTIRPLISELKILMERGGLTISDRTIYMILVSGIVFKLIEFFTQIISITLLGIIIYAVLKTH